VNDFLFYIYQGFFHVLDVNALDHVLFFIALIVIFTFKDWKKALWLITFFTLGHTLTFILSAYDILDINVDLVEFLIPITILVPLLLNIYLSVKKNEFKHNTINIYFAFFFGLIHGLGFSNYFKMLLDDGDDKLIPLLEFAIGIEFAQIVIVLIILSFAYLFQSVFKVQKRIWIIVISVVVILSIIPILIERKFW
jgi:hypothetical protein